MRTLASLLLLSALIAGATACSAAPEASPDSQAAGTSDTASMSPTAATPVFGYRIVNRFPHDRMAYTQGLIVRDGVFYESTGQYGRSSLRQVAINTGEVLQKRDVAPNLFAEGLTDWEDTLLQLTWTSRRGFVYDLETFEPRREFTLPGEGWGLTHDGSRLILSDGSSQLHFLDPATFVVTGSVTVTDGDAPVEDLNELEWVEGEVFANIWQQERIARIDPATGRVTGWIDLDGLRPGSTLGEIDSVLNGIAWDATARRLFVTGKQWPTIFEIALVPPR